MRDRVAPGVDRVRERRGRREPRGLTPDRPAPEPAVVLRRALIAWGLGHLALGDRRGAALLVLELVAAAGLVVLAVAYTEGARYPWVYLALVAFFAAWAWQAVDAYRRAVELGGQPSGAIQVVVLAPIALVVFTGFWLVGGTGGSPAAPLRSYVAAWREDDSASASRLFIDQPAPDRLAAQWASELRYLGGRATALARGGRAEDLDPSRPLDALYFELGPATVPSANGEVPTATATVEFVRQQTVSGSFFGLFPTASQRRVVLERVGSVVLRAVERPTVVGVPDVVWRIESVSLPGASGT